MSRAQTCGVPHTHPPVEKMVAELQGVYKEEGVEMHMAWWESNYVVFNIHLTKGRRFPNESFRAAGITAAHAVCLASLKLAEDRIELNNG